MGEAGFQNMVLKPSNGLKTKPVRQAVKPSKQPHRPLTKRHPLKDSITRSNFLERAYEFSKRTPRYWASDDSRVLVVMTCWMCRQWFLI